MGFRVGVFVVFTEGVCGTCALKSSQVNFERAREVFVLFSFYNALRSTNMSEVMYMYAPRQSTLSQRYHGAKKTRVLVVSTKKILCG